MPLVRVTRNVAFDDGRSYDAGDRVEMTPEQAQEAGVGEWGELVREQRPETPEGSRARRTPAPERRTRRRGGDSVGGYTGSGDRETMGPPPDIPSGAVKAR